MKAHLETPVDGAKERDYDRAVLHLQQLRMLKESKRRLRVVAGLRCGKRSSVSLQ